MRKSTKLIAQEMGLQPVSLWTALKLMLKGVHVGYCYGRKSGKGVRATIHW